MDPDSNTTPDKDRSSTPPSEQYNQQAEPAPVEDNASHHPDAVNLDKEPNSVPDSEPAESTSSAANQPLPVDSVATGSQPAAHSQPEAPRKKPKKPLIVAIVAVGMVVLLGGGAAAYSLWYQNPQRVVTDAIANMLEQRNIVSNGTVNIKNISDANQSVDKITLAFDSRSTGRSGQFDAKLTVHSQDDEYTIDANAIADSDMNIYFKVKGVEAIAEQYMGVSDELPAAVMQIIEKIEDSWIRVSTEDLDDGGQLTEAQKCTTDVIEKHRDNDATRRQIADTYRANQFIVIKDQLGSKDGNLGYVMGGDNEKLESFLEQLKDTDFYKELKECDDSFEVDTDDVDVFADSDSSGSVEVWISRFDHELKQIKAVFTDDDEVEVSSVVNFEYDEAVTIEAPSEYIGIKELIEEITDAFIEQMQNTNIQPEG